MEILDDIKQALQVLAIPEKAEFFPRFFKTGKGEYGEGDVFIGVTVPDQRIVAKEFYNKISLEELSELLSSKIHEHRLTSLLILVYKFEKIKDKIQQKEIIDFYLKHTKHINNWDLVDTSCYKILGRYCFENQDSKILEKLSDSDDMWEKRMAIVGTMFHIKKREFEPTKTFALKNLKHPHDLMHKANGWLLREMGKMNETELLNFLDLHYKEMPRTCLRYAIEKLDEQLRQDYLKGRI
ncbi:DNA alkylation repair protein [Epilithonimonas arachidiradicis]|uniref:3-methyladenine DNA glycosylase AlkD n=1 Tax=Epilithonimonas arachidiradicis TaxID=1617282 RepID=A0A420DD10_9FLAO|nr:DNA alkylation repair protein [Epilithonimonas arachidiradicis]RKE89537.1 3-methyladenine DNA glycosylase AlkD [Epilithonimonas arachidiradicis]GGG43242.1 DNA alkylation repair protein [Epilithonimonas arachidiradicis]